MDQLDLKVLRALASQSGLGRSGIVAPASLRSIARQLGADDMTVTNRYKKLYSLCVTSPRRLYLNPAFFGYEVLDAVVYVGSESAKEEVIRKLTSVRGVFAISNFFGKGLKVIALHKSDAERSRIIKRISRIAQAERMTLAQMAVPKSETVRLTETKLAIIQALTSDAGKPLAVVAGELGVSSRVVRSHVGRMMREKTLFSIPNLNIGTIPGLIPLYLSYSYLNREVKRSVDSEVRSHFDENYLWGGFTDPDRGFVVLAVPSMADVQNLLRWARKVTGISDAEADVLIEMTILSDKVGEMLSPSRLGRSVTRNNGNRPDPYRMGHAM